MDIVRHIQDLSGLSELMHHTRRHPKYLTLSMLYMAGIHVLLEPSVELRLCFYSDRDDQRCNSRKKSEN